MAASFCRTPSGFSPTRRPSRAPRAPETPAALPDAPDARAGIRGPSRGGCVSTRLCRTARAVRLRLDCGAIWMTTMSWCVRPTRAGYDEPKLAGWTSSRPTSWQRSARRTRPRVRSRSSEWGSPRPNSAVYAEPVMEKQGGGQGCGHPTAPRSRLLKEGPIFQGTDTRFSRSSNPCRRRKSGPEAAPPGRSSAAVSDYTHERGTAAAAGRLCDARATDPVPFLTFERWWLPRVPGGCRFVVATADSPTVPWLPARRDNQ
jgi:hypothetical protein